MQKIKLKRKTDGKEVECTIEILDSKNLKKVVELERIIVENLPSKDLFQDDTDDLILDCLGRSGIAYGIFDDEKLIACFALYFPKDKDDNLGLDIDLKKEELMSVAHIEINIVHPDYRGNKLQVVLNKILVKKAKEKGFRHLLAVTSPYNKTSHANLEKLGLKKVTTKIKFGDKLRDIMYMKI